MMDSSAAKRVERAPRDLSEEAAAHLTLAKLLMRKRPHALRGELRKIIESNQSTAEKVAAIRTLDAKSTRGAGGLAELHRGVELPFSMTRARSVVKLPQPRIGLFRYLFRERPKIIEHGYRTHTLSQALLVPVLRLDPHLTTKLGDELQASLPELLRALELVLERGWQHLTKREYNLIVILYRLCRVIAATNLKYFDLRDKELLQKLQSLETLFFFLYTQSGSPDIIIDAFARVLSFQSDLPSEQVGGATRMARRILLKDFDLPSIYNFLMTLNMLHARRFLTDKELIAKDLDSMVDVSNFSVSAPLRERIVAFVEELNKKLEELGRAKQEHERLRGYVPVESGGTPDFGELRRFYDRGLDSADGTAFLHDRDNVVLFIPRLLRLFDSTYAPFLSGKLRLTRFGVGVVFTPEFFGSDLQRLRNIGAKLDRLFFDFRSLPYKKYLGIKAGANVAIPLEREIVAQLDDALAIFLGVARRLDRVLARAGDAEGEASGRALDASVLHANRVVLPFGDAKIIARGELGGKGMREAMRSAVVMCYLIASYLRDEELLATLTQGEAIQKRLDSQLATLKRVADEETYNSAVTRLLSDAVAANAGHAAG